ncbi:MAG: indole-3-glycerol phosphate synthase TrpC [Proteobacteria bacterium]|nr:indole-3-glycerol phosphate synthase TrpC [Pseudomonadota bacterium]
MSFLKEVVREKKERVAEKKRESPLSELKKRLSDEKRSFFDIFSKIEPYKTRIIAEVKRASPSKGLLRADFNPLEIAKIYENNGASALSVITEEKFFLGSLDYIQEIRKIVKLPLLRKDFLVDEYEIYEAKAYSADAILLISEILEKNQIKDYLELAKELDLDVLIEVHSINSYEKISDLKGYLLGINNRNLETLKIDVNTAFDIIRNLPVELPVIVESGIDDRKIIERYLLNGVRGFLIGSSLVKADDIGKKLRELLGSYDQG